MRITDGVDTFKPDIGTYRQLIHTNFAVIKFNQNFQPTARPRGKVAAAGAGKNAAGVVPQIVVGTNVNSMKCSKAYFASAVTDDSAAAVTYPAEITVTAYKADGTAYTDFARCNYIAGGQVQECIFPSCWGQMKTLKFEMTEDGGAGSTGKDATGALSGIQIGGVTNSGVVGVGTPGFLMDDLQCTLTCRNGAPGTDGLCPNAA